jgi:hypothetical protein
MAKPPHRGEPDMPHIPVRTAGITPASALEPEAQGAGG